jgi:hypothetical protein
MSETIEILLNRFFPSNLLPWFEEGATGWDTLALGFDTAIEETVSGWTCYGFDHFPIWLSFDLRAALSHDRDTGHLVLSIHPSQLELERHLAFLLWCGGRTL